MSKLSRSLRLKRACFSRGKLETYLAPSSFAYTPSGGSSISAARHLGRPLLAKSVNFWALPESFTARLHARLPAKHRGSHARHRKSPRETPDGKSSSPPKKPDVFNLVFELYINFSELYIKWSRTIYKFLRTIYKISGKIPGLPGESHGIPGQGLRAGKHAIELYPVD